MAASSRARRGGTVASPPSAGRAVGADTQKSAGQHRSARLVHQFARDREELGIQASAADAGEPARTAGDLVGRLADQGVGPVLAVGSPRDGRDDSGHDAPGIRATAMTTATSDMTNSRTSVPWGLVPRDLLPALAGSGAPPGLVRWATASPSVHDMHLLSDTYR